MGDLSRNFSSREFRCRCGCDRAEVNPRLVEALQQLRDLAGRPIRITSGYRCPDHNRAKGGKKRSQHLLGNAADLAIDGLSVIEMYCLADKVAAVRSGGIGLYPKNGIIHVDVRDGYARWGRLGKKYVALATALSAQRAGEKPTKGDDHATA